MGKIQKQSKGNDWIDKFYDYSAKTFKDKQMTRFIDGDGYSLVGEYTPVYKKQMGVGNKGNQIPFFKVYFDRKKENKNVKYIPLIIRVSVTTPLVEGSNVRYMLNDSTIKRVKPIELMDSDTFYISTDDGRVYEKKRSKFHEVPLTSVYKRLYKVHTSDLRSLLGIYRRFKIFVLRRLPSQLFSMFGWIFGWLIWILKGKRYKYNVIVEQYLNKSTDVREIHDTKSPLEQMDFFGYKVSVWTLYSFSLAVIISGLIVSMITSRLIFENTNESAVFTTAFAVVSIVTYDKIAPLAFRKIVQYVENIAYDIKYRGIKLKV